MDFQQGSQKFRHVSKLGKILGSAIELRTWFMNHPSGPQGSGSQFHSLKFLIGHALKESLFCILALSVITNGVSSRLIPLSVVGSQVCSFEASSKANINLIAT